MIGGDERAERLVGQFREVLVKKSPVAPSAWNQGL
jgi:hypothetical protein